MAGATLSVDIERRFPRGATIRAAFELDLARAQTMVLFGPSGVGKTTVLRCLAGLETPDAGRIAVAGLAWFDARRGTRLAPQKRRVGYLPQGFALFPHLDVRGNIGFGLTDAPAADRRQRVTELIRLLALDGLERRRPTELSGGQQQRVALARALARGPSLLALDEPLSALDAPTRETVRSELRELIRAGGVPAIIVTHERSEALALADQVGVMVDGVLRQVGPSLEVFDRPTDEAVARIVGVETVVPATVLEASDGLLRLRVGEAELTAVAEPPATDSVLVSIRAEDVILVAEPGEARAVSSARNRLAGRVISIEPHGPLVRVRLHCGFPLVAAITRPAVAELDLRPGSAVAAILKAPAVHVIG